MLDFLNSLFVGSILDVLVFSVAGGEGLSVRGAGGLNTLTSKKVRSKRPLQNQLVAMSSLAPSFVMAEVPERASPVIGCKVGSMHTL